MSSQFKFNLVLIACACFLPDFCVQADGLVAPQGTPWNNGQHFLFVPNTGISADSVNKNFDQLFTQVNGLQSSVSTSSVVPSSGAPDGSLGWMKVVDKIIASPLSGDLLALSGLDGNAHHSYFIELDGTVNALANSYMLLQVNGDVTAGHYNSYWHHFGTTTYDFRATGGLLLTLTNHASSVHTVAYLSASSGAHKVLTGTYTLSEGSNLFMGPVGGAHLDTGNLTSLRIFTGNASGVTNAMPFKGRITVYRKR